MITFKPFCKIIRKANTFHFFLLVSYDLWCQKPSLNQLRSFQSMNLNHIPLLPYLVNKRGKNLWSEIFKNLIEICMKYCFHIRSPWFDRGSRFQGFWK